MARPLVPGPSPVERTRGWRRRQVRSAEILRTEGGRRLLARAAVQARAPVYRSVDLIYRDLSEQPPQLSSSLPIEVGLLQEVDVGAWRRHRRDLAEAAVEERLSRLGKGHSCVVAWLDGEIVASVWLALDEARIPEIGRRLWLGPGDVFAYDSYTNETVRGHGIATARAVWTTNHLRDAGYTTVIGHVAGENPQGRGPPARAGYRTLGTAGYLRVGPWRREFVRPVGSARRWSRARDVPIDLRSEFGLDSVSPELRG